MSWRRWWQVWTMKSSIKLFHYLQVYLVYHFSRQKSREIAEEITQNTFYKAVSTTSQFKGKSDELTWLCSIAKNLYHDEMRSRQRVADVSETTDFAIKWNVENSVADSDMAFRGIQFLLFHRLKNHSKKSFSFAYSGNYLFHKSLQFLLEKQNQRARVNNHRAKLKIQERDGWKSMSKTTLYCSRYSSAVVVDLVLAAKHWW